ncbi:MAG: MerR family transcriptional regulator [Pseudomonadota bacterium]
MENLGLTHKDLAKALGVSETTIKSYRRKFPACITVASKGKPIRFSPEAETVCRRIQALFALGMAVEDVRVRLAEEFSWIERDCPMESAEAVNAEQNQQASSSSAHHEADSEHKKALLNEAARLKEALQQSPPAAQLAPMSAQKNLMPQSASPSAGTVLGNASAPASQNPAQSTDQISSQDAAKSETPRTTPYTVLPPEVRTAISDMARSVVELTLQQKKLMKHVQSLEERLEKALSSGDIAASGPQDTGSQGLCPQTPIHEQISAPSSAADSMSTPSQDPTAESYDSPDADQKPSRGNPLLKIFGLERHG